VAVPDFGDLRGSGQARELIERIEGLGRRVDALAERFDMLDQGLADVHNAVVIGPDYRSLLDAPAVTDAAAEDAPPADDDDELS